MSAASSMSEPTLFPATATAISSPGSAAGDTPSSLPDGIQLDLFGPAPVPASPSPPPESKAAALTSDIFGLRGFGSSASVALTLSLANRLRERLGSDGSTEYSQTWKRLVTPAGRRYWAHTASGRRTSGSGSSGWRSPAAQESGVPLDRLVTKDGKPWTPGQRAYDRETGRFCETGLQQQAEMAGWPTPNGDDANNRTRDSGCYSSLTRTILTAGWPTPNTADGERGTEYVTRKEGNNPTLLGAARLAG